MKYKNINIILTTLFLLFTISTLQAQDNSSTLNDTTTIDIKGSAFWGTRSYNINEERLLNKELKELLIVDNQLLKGYNNGNAIHIAGQIAIIIGGGMVIYGIGSFFYDAFTFNLNVGDMTNGLLILTGGIISWTGITLQVIGIKKKDKVINIYNSTLNQHPQETSFWDNKELELGIEGVGLGVKLRF